MCKIFEYIPLRHSQPADELLHYKLQDLFYCKDFKMASAFIGHLGNVRLHTFRSLGRDEPTNAAYWKAAFG